VGKRIFSSTLLWAIVITTMWFLRNTGAIILGVLVSMLTLREFYRLMRGCGYTPFDRLGTVCGGIITVAPVLELKFGFPTHLVLALATVVFAVRLLGERTPENRVESLCSTLFGLVYVSLLLQYYVRIVLPVPGDTISPNGRLLICLWVIATSKFCDMGGLLTGMAIGRHKMSPQISPKKTWEGAVGGIIASVAIGAAIAWFGRDLLPPRMTPLMGALMAAPIAILGIVGDLVESVIKRRANIKDSAAIIPAMGGFFDMSDSLILTAPVGYFFLTLLV
jgi:phosphatidate cytidylyltransferase